MNPEALAEKAWGPIGWRVVQCANPNTAHLWMHSGYDTLTHAACGLLAVDQQDVLPESEADRRCTNCAKTMVSQWFDIHGVPKMEPQKTFPATVTVHTPEGWSQSCERHARMIESRFEEMESYSYRNKAPDGAECKNCKIEAKESKCST